MSMPWDANLYRVAVIDHHDADTSHILASPGFDLDIHLTVRWFGVNAPELSTPEGKAALAWVNEIAPPGSVLTMRSTKSQKDKYGRYLATLFTLDGDNLNQRLIDEGHAVVYLGGHR